MEYQLTINDTQLSIITQESKQIYFENFSFYALHQQQYTLNKIIIIIFIYFPVKFTQNQPIFHYIFISSNTDIPFSSP